MLQIYWTVSYEYTSTDIVQHNWSATVWGVTKENLSRNFFLTYIS